MYYGALETASIPLEGLKSLQIPANIRYQWLSRWSRRSPRSTVWPTVNTKPYIAAYKRLWCVAYLIVLITDTLRSHSLSHHLTPVITTWLHTWKTSNWQHIQRVLMGQYRSCLSVIDGITDRIDMGLRWPSRAREMGLLLLCLTCWYP